MASEGLPSFQQYASQPRPGDVSADDKQWGMYAHMSALLGIPIGGLTFLGPLLCWLFKRPASSYVETQAREALNFQINIVVLFLVTLPFAFFTSGLSLILTFAILIYGGVMAVMAGMRASEGQPFHYPATVRVIKERAV